MNMWQLTYSQFDKHSDHKHNTDLHGKLSTKLLVQAANEKTKFMFKSCCPEKLKKKKNSQSLSRKKNYPEATLKLKVLEQSSLLYQKT